MSIETLLNTELQTPTYWEFSFISSREIPEQEEAMRVYVQNVSLPFVSLEVDTDVTGMRYFTGYSPEEEFSITFLETAQFDVLTYLENWMNQIYDKENRVFRVGNKSRNGILSFQRSLPGTGSLQTTRQYEFRNVLITSIDSPSLDYTSTDAFTISANFICDTVTQT